MSQAPSKIRPVEQVDAAAFQLLVQSVKDYGIFMLDPEGNIRTWNLGAERIKGYRSDEVIGKHFSIFYTQADRDRRHPDHELAIARVEGRFEEEGWRLRKDGSRFWASVVITRLTDSNGVIVGFGKVTRDLTERKKVEEALRRSEEQTRLMTESVRDYAIITLDPKGHVMSWNEGARRIKGYEASEIIGKHFSMFYVPEDAAAGNADYELREAALTGRFEDEGWRIRKDGTRFWANVVVTALYDSDHNLRGYSKVTRDITERKRAEDRLRMANETLERRVHDRTDELTRANESLLREVSERRQIEGRLQDAIRARDEFLSIASHELRTPITPLKLHMQILLRQLQGGGAESLDHAKLGNMARAVDRSLDRLSHLIDSLLDVARINTGRITFNPEDMDAAETLREIARRHEQEAGNVGTELTLQAPTSLPVHLDRLRYEQIVTNLLTNAIRYGEGNPIHLSVERRGDRLFTRVRDQGVGISEVDKGRIFGRFTRLTSSSHHAAGMGLGLFITKQIVDSLGGAITVTSNPGKGSEFCVELPIRVEAKPIAQN